MFDAVVVGQLVFGHLQAAGMWKVTVFRFIERLFISSEALPSVTGDTITHYPV